MYSKLRMTSLCFGLGLLVATAGFGQDVDWDHVKENWDSFTAEEQAVYKDLKITMGKPARATGAAGQRVIALGQELQPTNRAPSNQCGMTPEVSALPFSDMDSTAGATNDYDIDTTAIAACDTGFESAAREQTYLLRVDADCDLTVTESSATFDVVLWAVTDCNDTDNTCVASSDTGSPESFTFSATAGTDYWLIMDGFLDTDDFGDYTIEVTEATANGCQLVPVELQSFEVN